MSSDYQRILEATTAYLRDLKNSGRKFVALTPASLQILQELQTPTKAAKSKPLIRNAEPFAPIAIVPPAIGSAQKSPMPAAPAATPAPVVLHPAPISAPKATGAIAVSDKINKMAELRARALACQMCQNLASSRKNVVFGVGSMDADLMFIGEAPGADEDEQGEPFVGRAGQLLTKIIQTMGLSRETVYIANILKCRPDTPGQTSGNRKPSPTEMSNCFPFLKEQVALIQPKIIVALGASAVEGLLGKSGISRLRGTWQSYMDVPVMPTYHPSYLLRPENAARKRETWEDMLQVMERLGLPVSEKQRGYFLSK